MNPTEHNGSSSTETRAAASRLVVNAGQPAPAPKLGRWVLVLFVLLVAGVIAGLIPRLQHRKELDAESRDLAIPTVNVVSPVPGKATTALNLPAEVKPF